MNTKKQDMTKKRRLFPVELKQHRVREIETWELSLCGVQEVRGSYRENYEKTSRK